MVSEISSAKRILVVEDDDALRLGLQTALVQSGYEVLMIDNGEEAEEQAIKSSYHLLLLDLMLPGQDGMVILRRLRRIKPHVPVIIITARGSEHDRICGLRSGADDYVVKPFSIRELLARIEAVLRRSSAAELPRLGVLRFGHGYVDLDRREIVLDSGTVNQLSERECQILSYLATHIDRTVPREELLEKIWHINPRSETRTVDMHIARLRAKCRDSDEQPDVIVTVWREGYKLQGVEPG
ncbi:MAG: DNA-binding response regulator [Lentisphaerae bacterium]|nr:MAG: DNA-binding response regulator [Lentisphaerota bacterium]